MGFPDPKLVPSVDTIAWQNTFLLARGTVQLHGAAAQMAVLRDPANDIDAAVMELPPDIPDDDELDEWQMAESTVADVATAVAGRDDDPLPSPPLVVYEGPEVMSPCAAMHTLNLAQSCALRVDDYRPDPDIALCPATAGNLSRRALGVFHDLYVPPLAMDRLRGAGRLNDEVMYAGLVSLALAGPDSADRVACFHPFEYSTWRDGKTPRKMMRSVRKTAFWAKDAILVPVFDNDHWMLASVYPAAARIEFFDSLNFTSTLRAHCGVRPACRCEVM